MNKSLSISILILVLLAGCSRQDPAVETCRNHISVMIGQMKQLESEITAENVCFECIERTVKETGGVEDLSRKMNRCSIDGHYNYDIDLLVASADKRLDNIIFEVDWLQTEKPSARYHRVIQDSARELQPILREISSQLAQ